MTKKKSGFWTFIFSLLPGAAEMYMGFMKMGVSLMGLFFGLFIIGGFFGQSIFVLADIVVWFYAFFHAHNLRAMDDEEFYALEDGYLFHLDQIFTSKWLEGRRRDIAAWAMILLGLSIFWGPAVRWLVSMVDAWMSPGFAAAFAGFLYQIPRFIVAGVLIVGGILLIQGKKKELEKEEDENS